MRSHSGWQRVLCRDGRGETVWAWLLALACLNPAVSFGAQVCSVPRFNDWKDLGCSRAWLSGMLGGGNLTPGGNQGGCTPCGNGLAGMPRWWVSEPLMNLWLADEPLSYTTSAGQAMAFRWTYRQRYQLPPKEACPNFYYVGSVPRSNSRLELDTQYGWMRTMGMTNATWSHNWLSDVVLWDRDWELQYPPGASARYEQGYEVLIHRADASLGYARKVGAGGGPAVDSGSLARVLPLSALGYPTVNYPAPSADGYFWSGSSTNGVRLAYPDGSQDVYGLTVSIPYPGASGNTTARAFLTRRIDAQGRVTTLAYERAQTTNVWGQPVSLPFRLRYVVDADNRTNRFFYTTDVCFADTNAMVLLFQVARIEDPYGRALRVEYGATTQWPARLIDAAGLTNAFAYQGPNGWLTNLTTPYGDTRFYHGETAPTNQGTNRCVRVRQPDESWQMFFYRNEGTNLPAGPGAQPVPAVASAVFDHATNSYYPGSWQYRNTFHWNARQCATLSAKGYTNLFTPDGWGNFVAPETVLQPADYALARMKHWLLHISDADANLNNSLASLASWEREPAFDSAGAQPGLRTWFAYGGQEAGNPALAPTNGALPSFVVRAQVLPNGETQYRREDNAGAEHLLWPGRLTQITESVTLPNGTLGTRAFDLTYTTNADLQTVTGPLGYSLGLAFNTNRFLLRQTNALGEVTQFMPWPVQSKLGGVNWSGGATATLNYYGSGAAASNRYQLSDVTWAPAGRRLDFTWDQGLVKTVSDNQGLSLTHTWDGLNRLTSTTYPDGTYTSNRYDKLDLVGTRDRLGRWTWYGYDALQRLRSITDARSNTTWLTWCECGGLESVTDPLTNATVFYYNNQGRLTGVVAQASSLFYRYDPAGRLTNVFDGANRAVKLGWNNQGLLTTVSNAYGPVWRVVYDALNRPQQVTDAHHVTVTNSFDALDRLLARVWQDGLGERYGWSSNGLAAHTNRTGQVTRYTRNAAGWLLGVTNANQAETRFGYNPRGELTDLWDGNTNRTQWSYDLYGHVTSKVNALGQQVLGWSYDPNGHLTNRWTPQFGDTAYAYDAVGNLTSSSSLLASNSFAYDPLNRLTNLVDAVGQTKFTYTAAGQLESEDGPWTDDTISYGYTQGHRTGMTLAQPGDDWLQQFTYDAAWRLTNLTSSAGTFTYGYGAPSSSSALVRTLALPNVAWITNHYDSLARLDYTALVSRWGHVLDAAAYTHDPLGLRTNVLRDLGWTTNQASVGYDAIGQLTTWLGKETDGTARLNEQLRYAYDPAGNLRTRTNGSLTQTFGHNPLNQLTSVARSSALTVSGVTPVPATSVTVNGQPANRYADFTFARTNVTLSNGNNTFEIIASRPGATVTNTSSSYLPASNSLLYDLNGNLTNDGLRHFRYDAENQLTTNWVAGAWKQEFVYDAFGRKRIERTYGWTGGDWNKTNEVRYVYDGMLAIQERSASNVPQVTYTRGLDLSASLSGAGGIGGLLARTDHSLLASNSYLQASSYYHADGAGNITALIDQRNTIAARYAYDPFGRQLAQWGPLADVNRYRFSSKEVQPLSGLYYYGFRFLDPSLQRWLNPDPLGEAGGLNLYQFVYNDPLDWVDDWGMAGLRLGLSSGARSGRSGQMEGEITREMRESLRRGRPLGPEEQIAERLLRNASERALVQRGLDPSRTYIGPPERPIRPPTAEELTEYVRGHPESLTPCLTALARRLGKEGEEAAGIRGPKRQIPSLTGTAERRFPDQITKDTLTEVKNVRHLRAPTDQLRDYVLISQRDELRFDLVVRQNTDIGPTAEMFLSQNQVNVVRDLPAR